MTTTAGYPTYTTPVDGAQVQEYGLTWQSSTYNQQEGPSGSKAIALDSSDQGQGQVNLYFSAPTINAQTTAYVDSSYPTDSCWVTSILHGVQLGISINTESNLVATQTGTFTIITPG